MGSDQNYIMTIIMLDPVPAIACFESYTSDGVCRNSTGSYDTISQCCDGSSNGYVLINECVQCPNSREYRHYEVISLHLACISGLLFQV